MARIPKTCENCLYWERGEVLKQNYPDEEIGECVKGRSDKGNPVDWATHM